MTPDLNVLERMQALIDGWEANGDRRAIFLTCYSMMTRNMLRTAETGEFEDSGWVSHLLHRFAEYYFSALEGYERRDPHTPAVWQYTFETTLGTEIHVLQHLILGVNAHINYDLVLALRELLEPEWAGLTPEQCQMRYRDHCRVNDIIYQTIDSVQDQVVEHYSPSMDLVDKVFGRLDEWLIRRLISAWREEVWQRTQHLIISPSKAASEDLHEDLELNVMTRAQAIAGQRGLTGLLDVIT